MKKFLILIFSFIISCNNDNYICKDNIKIIRLEFIEQCINMGSPYINTASLDSAINICIERSNEIFCEKQINCNQ